MKTDFIYILIAAILCLASALTVFLHKRRASLKSGSEVIKRYSDRVSHTLSVGTILNETVSVIRGELKVERIIICLRENDVFIPSRGGVSPFRISAENPFVRKLESGDNHVVLDEYEANPLNNLRSKIERKALDDNGIVSICALRDGSRVIGLLLLSEKETKYSRADYNFLNTVCSVASMALKNASLYEQVSEREKLFSSMTAFIPNVILIKKKNEPRFSFVSSNTKHVLGLELESFGSGRIYDVLEECVDAKTAKKLAESFDDTPESGCMYDVPFRRPDDKSERTLRFVFSPIASEDIVTHNVCVISDISEDIQARELLESSALIAQNSNKAKSDFLSQMSHEIRTPLNSIAGLTYLAREHVSDASDSELTEYLDKISSSSNYLISMLNNIMDMSKIENRQYEIIKKPFDAKKVLDDIRSVYSSQMKTKGITLEYVCEDLKHEKLLGDEIALRKILNNLLSNAYKYTQQYGRVVLYATERAVSAQTVVMHFEIADNGKGISREFAEKVFEPYKREAAQNADTENGSGLGLAICKNIVDLQGGQISVSSELGVGTKFTVDIPYSICEAENKEKTAQNDLEQLYGKRIMVVDDVPINTVITSKLLEKYGAFVSCAQDGMTAIELFEDKADGYYDCIIMDIQMPEMDGFETVRNIRACKKFYAPTVPIVAMTADAFISDSVNADRSCFDEYIIKPVSPDELYAKLIRLFKEKTNV